MYTYKIRYRYMCMYLRSYFDTTFWKEGTHLITCDVIISQRNS